MTTTYDQNFSFKSQKNAVMPLLDVPAGGGEVSMPRLAGRGRDAHLLLLGFPWHLTSAW